ncbi:MAG: septum formation initiator family protein [Candidatus Caldatribacteriaceae bacterium]
MNRIKSIWMVGLLLCFFGALFHLSLQAILLEKGFWLETKRKSLENLVAEKGRLEIEIARLASLERIQEVAQNRLGMTSPQQVVYVVAGNKLGEVEKQFARYQEGRGEGQTK